MDEKAEKAPFAKLHDLLIEYDMKGGTYEGWLAILTQHGWTQAEYQKATLDEIYQYLAELGVTP